VRQLCGEVLGLVGKIGHLPRGVLLAYTHRHPHHSDILNEDGETRLRIGDPPLPVPEPFAALLRDYLDQRPNQNTAANPASTWLFPGRRAGRPIDPTTIRDALREAGVPALGGRIATLRQLVLQAPAPVVASMLGYHDTTTAPPPRPNPLEPICPRRPQSVTTTCVMRPSPEHRPSDHRALPVSDPFPGQHESAPIYIRVSDGSGMLQRNRGAAVEAGPMSLAPATPADTRTT